MDLIRIHNYSIYIRLVCDQVQALSVALTAFVFLFLAAAAFIVLLFTVPAFRSLFFKPKGKNSKKARPSAKRSIGEDVGKDKRVYTVGENATAKRAAQSQSKREREKQSNDTDLSDDGDIPIKKSATKRAAPKNGRIHEAVITVPLYFSNGSASDGIKNKRKRNSDVTPLGVADGTENKAERVAKRNVGSTVPTVEIAAIKSETDKVSTTSKRKSKQATEKTPVDTTPIPQDGKPNKKRTSINKKQISEQ